MRPIFYRSIQSQSTCYILEHICVMKTQTSENQFFVLVKLISTEFSEYENTKQIQKQIRQVLGRSF